MEKTTKKFTVNFEGLKPVSVTATGEWGARLTAARRIFGTLAVSVRPLHVAGSFEVVNHKVGQGKRVWTGAVEVWQ